MEKSIFVVSDLHLGGREGFEMCSLQGREQLADFIKYVAKQRRDDREVQLVINGDAVDFLAQVDRQGEYSGFTANEESAVFKLEGIFERSTAVWAALRDLGKAGCGLSVLLGNHDIELCLPRVRQRLQKELGGNAELIYDNQALSLGEVVIEHGNRYDAWNVVPHDTLRRIRSQLSRGEKAPNYPVQPGSLLVVNVMNHIKQKYPWVDLLKPETGGLLKLLRVFGAIAPLDVIKALRQAVRMADRWLQFDRDGLPTDEEFVNASSAARGYASLEDELVSTGAVSMADDLDELARAPDQNPDLAKILKAFRDRAAKDATTFNVDIESGTYLAPAESLAQRFRVIVFGHTHLAKVKLLDNGALYLNTGTWADIMRVPESAYSGPESKALADLGPFVEALRKNDIARLRRLVPTYARIDLTSADRVQAAGVFCYDGEGHPQVPLSTSEMLKRIGS